MKKKKKLDIQYHEKFEGAWGGREAGGGMTSCPSFLDKRTKRKRQTKTLCWRKKFKYDEVISTSVALACVELLSSSLLHEENHTERDISLHFHYLLINTLESSRFTKKMLTISNILQHQVSMDSVGHG